MFLLNNRGNNRYNYKKTTQDVTFPMQRLVPINETTHVQTAAIEPKPRIKEMLWGEPTWLFLHTLAEKIKEDDFPKLRKDLLDYIFKICNNLPCPICAQHATTYMKGVNFDNIQTKEQLKLLLFAFHNEVNKRKNYELFNVNQLSKYENANTVNVIRNFFYHFSKRAYNVRMAVDSMHRQKLLKNLKGWLESNVYSFYS
jgi:hypothetical protein